MGSLVHSRECGKSAVVSSHLCCTAKRFVFMVTCNECTAHKFYLFFLPILRSNRQLEPPLPLNFSYGIFRHSALATNFTIDPLFCKGDVGYLVQSREWRSDISFRDLLPSRPRRRNLKMWFQALEFFAVSRTVTRYIFYCCRTRTRTYTYRFFF